MMSIKEIIDKLGKLNIYEQRDVTEQYGEVVVYNKDENQWQKIVADLFGPPLKPTGEKPTEEALGLTENFGGIRNNQTLFKKELVNGVILAMFWPWQDGIHTTIKIILLKK